jgi:UDP-glucuronate decarboxylase
MYSSTPAKRKRVIVTGGAGFVGSHLCDRLAAENYSIICIDNLQTGSYRNITDLALRSDFEFHTHDVITPFEVEADQYYNLACAASPQRYQADPLHTFKTCVIGVMNGLDLARRHKARFLHASTSEIYGDPLQHPQTESYWGHVNPIGVRACYDEGKRAAETVIFDALRFGGAEARVCRIFNTYGPRMDPYDGRVVSNFIRQALMGEVLTVFGDGSQTRSFCYVDDLVEGLYRLMNAPHDVDGPVNLGNPGEFTVLELAETVSDLIGSHIDIEFLPLPQDDPKCRRPDVSKARRELDWEPRVDLKEGLRRTIDYLDDLLSAEGLRDRHSQDAA